ncbi:MAG: TerB family tellurite resistance protein [Vicinamibacterales bacterium]
MRYHALVALDALLGWLGLERAKSDREDQAPLRRLLESLDHLDSDRARHLARFAYLLGRVARADQHVSEGETAAMEAIVVEECGLAADQAVVVVGLAKSANLLFGGTADFEVARDFGAQATYPERLSLVRCLFRLAATDAAISVAEESELHRIANQLQIAPEDLTELRVAHARFLPGLAPRTP